VTFLPIPKKNVPFPEDMFLEKRCDALTVLDPQGSEHGNLHQEDFRMSHVFPSRPRGAFSLRQRHCGKLKLSARSAGLSGKDAVFF